jgi:hypothetical protein
MELTAKLRKQFVEAFEAAFPRYDDIRIMIMGFEIPETVEGIKLAAIVPEGKRQTIVCLDVLEWAEANGLVETLLQYARTCNQLNPKLKAVADILLVAPTPVLVLPPPDAPPLRDIVVSFRNSFPNRSTLFGHMNGYKGLHAALHRLQVYRPTLLAAIQARLADHNNPLPEDVVDYLGRQLEEAQNARKLAPDEDFQWIKILEEAIGVIIGDNFDKIDDKFEELSTLPAEQLKDLNKELIKVARKINFAELSCFLKNILNALTREQGPNATKSDLYRGVDEFSKLCQEVDDLIKTHDLCQRIEYALKFSAKQADKNELISYEDITLWSDVKTCLSELANQYATKAKGGSNASKVIEAKNAVKVMEANTAAKNFESSGQKAELYSLREKISNFFYRTDEKLLEKLRYLSTAALTLRNSLEAIP